MSGSRSALSLSRRTTTPATWRRPGSCSPTSGDAGAHRWASSTGTPASGRSTSACPSGPKSWRTSTWNRCSAAFGNCGTHPSRGGLSPDDCWTRGRAVAYAAVEMPRWADLFARILRGDAPPPPVATLVGMELVSVAPDRAVFTMDAGPQHGNPFRTVQGGPLRTLAAGRVGLAGGTGRDFARSMVARASSTCLTLRAGEEGGGAAGEEAGG